MRYQSGGAFRRALEDRLRSQSHELSRAIQATFEARGTHALPRYLPDAPANWNAPFGRLARDVAMPEVTLAVAMEMARQFLNPVLQGHAQCLWNAALWGWR